MYKSIFKQTAIAYCISLSITPALAEKGVNITAGSEYTATEGTVYNQGFSTTGGFSVNGGTLNIENNVTIDMTNANINPNGGGILILGNGSKVNGTDNLKIHVNQLQKGIEFKPNSSGSTISLGNNASITAENNSSINVSGSNHTLISGDNLSLASSYSALHVLANGSTINIGKNATLSSTGSSASVIQGQGNTVSVGDGGKLITSGYGVNLNGTDNIVNLGEVQVSGSRAVLMQGTNNTLTVASGSVLSGKINPQRPENGATTLAIGGTNNTVKIDNSTLMSAGGRTLRLGSSGKNAINDGNTVNLNNVTIKADYDDPNYQKDDSLIGILTTNNEQLDNEYEFTLNLNSGLIESTNSNLIDSSMELNQDSDLVSSAKTLINMNNVAMNNTNGHYLVNFGTSDLLQNRTDLTLNLTHTNATSFSKGIVNNDQSTLLLNLDASQIMGDIVNNSGSQGSMQINASNGSVIMGDIYSLNSEGIVDEDNAYTSVTLKNASWLHDQNSHVVDLVNGGNVIFNSLDNGHTLTVHGDYIGNDGYILFNGQLEGDDSTTDKLVVKGNTSGMTSVSVNNIGGQGAQTVNGIELINVSGDSAGVFEQSGRIVAGAYEYFLNRGEGDNSKNWYLTNQLDESGGSEVAIIRPEAGGYSNNLYVANHLFNTRLHDRLGETQYTDILTGEKKITSMWLRNVVGHTNVTSGDAQLKTGSNRYVMQLGGDIAQWSNNDANRYHLGLMAGHGRVSGKTTNTLTGYQAKSHVDGYSLGAYGTYYANQDDKTGLHVDTWAQYNWFNNRVNGDSQAEEKYDTRGITASVESGYTVLLNKTQSSKGNTNHWYVQPKAQLTYLGVTMGKHTEHNGTRVKGEGENSIQTRLGVKLFGQGHATQHNLTAREFQPFVEANWIYNSKATGTSMDGEKINQQGTRNIGEIKVGLEGSITTNTDMWFNIAQQVGKNSYSDTQGMLGVKLRF